MERDVAKGFAVWVFGLGVPRHEVTGPGPETTQTASLECLWRSGLPKRTGSLKETTQATQKRPPAAEARRF